MGEQGWPFANVDKYPAADEDPLYGSSHAKDLYLRAKEDYEGRYVDIRFPQHLSEHTA